MFSIKKVSIRMHRSNTGRLIFLLFFLTQANLFSQNLIQIKQFGKNPGNLKMYFYAPKKSVTDHATKRPLLLVLHGCTQSARIIAAQTDWNKFAEKYGFYIIYPQQKFINNADKCFCTYKRSDITKGKGENFSIKEMIDYVKKNYAIDTAQIFITGLSAGAAMSVVMMSNYPRLFNAGAIFAGTPYKSASNVFSALPVMLGWIHKTPEKWGNKVRKQNPDYKNRFPKIIIYQGGKDPIVNKRNGFELVKQWTNLHGIDTIPDVKLKPFAGNKFIEKNIYQNAEKENCVVFYKIKKLGHAYLIDPGKCLNRGGKRGIFSSDKNFFATYWTAMDFGLIKPLMIQGKIIVKSEEKNIVFSVPAHDGCTYSWTIPNGCTLVNGKDTNTITVNWGDHTGCVNVTETDFAGCSFPYHTIFVEIK